DTESQYELGLRYAEGEGVPQSESTAYRWLLRAAEARHAEAMAEVGRCLHDGTGVEVELGGALTWYEQALDAGARSVHADLGRLLIDEQVPARDPERARSVLEDGWELQGDSECAGLLAELFEDVHGDTDAAILWARRAAEAGDDASMVTLGYRHRYGLGLPRDFRAMVAWYERAAERGCATALSNLALCYQKGEGVRADETKAFTLMERAAAVGHDRARTWIAFAHVDGIGCDRDPVRGRALLEELAPADPEIAHDLADRLIDGPGLERDVRAGLRWMRRAADEGYPPAHTYLGVLHWYGRHVDPDRERALEYYRHAAELGEPYATGNLGFALLEGEGVTQNRPEGFEFIERAGGLGNAHAALWLAERLLSGDEDGLARDEAAAVRVLEACTENEEDGDALFLLAELVRDGRGTPADPERALELFTLAGLDGRDTRVEEAVLRRALRGG
ncbi:MAG: tetratricopeptide repeat protein, partial [Planctomycetota bacterium]